MTTTYTCSNDSSSSSDESLNQNPHESAEYSSENEENQNNLIEHTLKDKSSHFKGLRLRLSQSEVISGTRSLSSSSHHSGSSTPNTSGKRPPKLVLKITDISPQPNEHKELQENLPKRILRNTSNLNEQKNLQKNRKKQQPAKKKTPKKCAKTRTSKRITKKLEDSFSDILEETFSADDEEPDSTPPDIEMSHESNSDLQKISLIVSIPIDNSDASSDPTSGPETEGISLEESTSPRMDLSWTSAPEVTNLGKYERLPQLCASDDETANQIDGEQLASTDSNKLFERINRESPVNSNDNDSSDSETEQENDSSPKRLHNQSCPSFGARSGKTIPNDLNSSPKFSASSFKEVANCTTMKLNQIKIKRRKIKKKSGKSELKTKNIIELSKTLLGDDLIEFLTECSNRLKNRDNMEIFQKPVSDEIAPGYSKIIEQPMDFMKINDKILNRSYPNILSFLDDFLIMCNNAMSYNKSPTIYYREAKKMRDSGTTLLEKLARHKIIAKKTLLLNNICSKSDFNLNDSTDSKSLTVKINFKYLVKYQTNLLSTSEIEREMNSKPPSILPHQLIPNTNSVNTLPKTKHNQSRLLQTNAQPLLSAFDSSPIQSPSQRNVISPPPTNLLPPPSSLKPPISPSTLISHQNTFPNYSKSSNKPNTSSSTEQLYTKFAKNPNKDPFYTFNSKCKQRDNLLQLKNIAAKMQARRIYRGSFLKNKPIYDPYWSSFGPSYDSTSATSMLGESFGLT